MSIMIIICPFHPGTTLKWFFLLVTVFLGSIVLDVEANVEPIDDLEKQKYFIAEPTTSGSNETVVLATHNQTTRLQCRHRCNRKTLCTDVIFQPINMCVLLRKGAGEGVEIIDKMEMLSKIQMLLPG